MEFKKIRCCAKVFVLVRYLVPSVQASMYMIAFQQNSNYSSKFESHASGMKWLMNIIKFDKKCNFLPQTNAMLLQKSKGSKFLSAINYSFRRVGIVTNDAY